ncbi:MAG: 4-(cytidine 5'-diphospho)-2-C-methyl-D-erythritol kinase [Sedimentisphaerales bacterium]|nr:4-(cytidine 5'-diphospho)-2-C-methyl-D-erythritol kinase [Sedimentisphaerales bacterium]
MVQATEILDQFVELDGGLLVRAPAKLNLSLLVAGRRPDGYHQIKTVMAKVSLYDELTIRPMRSGRIELVCEGPYWAPQGPQNLVYRAANAFLKAADIGVGLHIRLRKYVAAGSGLGSASSDAAAVLLGLARIFRSSRPCDLAVLAAEVGSDVAFFLGGPLSLCTGRGELVQPIPVRYQFLALLIMPDVHVSTVDVYASYVHQEDLYQGLDRRLSELLATGRVDQVSGPDMNMLAPICLRLHPDLAALKGRIEGLIGPVGITGSGSGMFRLYDRQAICQAIADHDLVIKNLGCTSMVVSSNPW